jgi:hypothetical protein
VEHLPEPITPGRSWLKISKRKRVLVGFLAAGGGLVAVALDRWILGAGRGMYWLMIPLLLYIVLLVFRPQWVVQFEDKEQERLKNWKPHPGQFMR